MSNSDSSKPATDQGHESYADDAKARRILPVDSSGTVTSYLLRGHPDVNANCSTTFAITRSDGQPDSITATSSVIGTHTRTFTYGTVGAENNRVVATSEWVES